MHKGRSITAEGKKFLDDVAKTISKAQPVKVEKKPEVKPTIKQKQVAKNYIESVESGKPTTKKEIVSSAGYGKVSSQPSRVIDSKGVQEEIKPYLEGLVKFRRRVLHALEKKDLTRVEFRDLSTSLGKLTHDIQLLSGGSTDNVLVVTWEK